jgi:elongation factor Ts
MAEFTAKDVQALRQATGAGMMDAKKALEEAHGDAEAAANILREKGLVKAASRSDRENAEGAVAVAEDGNVAVMVQLKCETDFSAKTDAFVGLVDRLAEVVLRKGPDAVSELSDDIDQLKLTTKENIEIGEVIRFEAAEGNFLDTYLHKTEGRGKVGVVLEVTGGTQEQAHEIAKHIAFAKPTYLVRDEVPADQVEKERAFVEQQTKDEGKPEQAWPKIIEGKLTAFYKDRVLSEQDLFNEKGNPVSGALGGGSVVRFALATVGA